MRFLRRRWCFQPWRITRTMTITCSGWGISTIPSIITTTTMVIWGLWTRSSSSTRWSTSSLPPIQPSSPSILPTLMSCLGMVRGQLRPVRGLGTRHKVPGMTLVAFSPHRSPRGMTSTTMPLMTPPLAMRGKHPVSGSITVIPRMRRSLDCCPSLIRQRKPPIRFPRPLYYYYHHHFSFRILFLI